MMSFCAPPPNAIQNGLAIWGIKWNHFFHFGAFDFWTMNGTVDPVAFVLCIDVSVGKRWYSSIGWGSSRCGLTLSPFAFQWFLIEAKLINCRLNFQLLAYADPNARTFSPNGKNEMDLPLFKMGILEIGWFQMDVFRCFRRARGVASLKMFVSSSWIVWVICKRWISQQ